LCLIQCANCSYIADILFFTKNSSTVKKIDNCSICGTVPENFITLHFEEDTRSLIQSVVNLIINNFTVLTHENMEKISHIFNLTPVQEDGILRFLNNYGWREIVGGIVFDV
jgi:hypothetical protein